MSKRKPHAVKVPRQGRKAARALDARRQEPTTAKEFEEGTWNR